jgi:hypothetical protein
MDKEKVINVDRQLWLWCEGIKNDIEEFFSGSAIKLNNKVQAMAELNDLDKRLLRKYIYLFWMAQKTKDEEGIRRIREKRLQIVEKLIAKGGSDSWILG